MCAWPGPDPNLLRLQHSLWVRDLYGLRFVTPNSPPCVSGRIAQLLTTVSQSSSSASDSSPCTSSDKESPSWDFESETDEPLSSSPASNSTDSSESSGDDESASLAENDFDVKR